MNDNISLKNYIENVETAVLKYNHTQNSVSFDHLDLLSDENRKLHEKFENVYYDNYKFLIDSIYDFFDSLDQGFEKDEKGDIEYYKEKLLSYIDYFKFKNQIITDYKHKNSPFV